MNHRPRLVQCTTCADGIPYEHCRLNTKHPKFSGVWRRCDWWHRLPPGCRRPAPSMPEPLPMFVPRPAPAELPPKPTTEEVLSNIRLRLIDAGLAGHVLEVVLHGRDVAMRLQRGAPYHIKQAVGQVLRD